MIETIDGAYVQALLRPRPRDSHKGDYGRILMIAGSLYMTGAAILCARGAYRSGSGLVRIAALQPMLPAVFTAVPEATCVDRRSFIDSPESVLADVHAAAVGPGLGRGEETRKIVDLVLKYSKCPVVLDADALNVLSDEPGILKGIRGRCIITPHAGEAARLLKTDVREINRDRLAAVKALASLTGCISVLKGEGTLVALAKESMASILCADSDRVSQNAAGNSGAATAYNTREVILSAESVSIRVLRNTTGNPGMAAAGSGDVLTGVIASFAGQGLAPLDAAAAGVYIHGMAGDLAAAEIGEYGMIASDIANNVPIAINSILKEGG